MDLLKRMLGGGQDPLAEIRRKTDLAQSNASDPASSVWVSANAGTGKTHVLTMRVLRLLLSGTAPERILALTYTKAAAAEMSKRVFAELAKWVTATDKDLAKILAKLNGAEPSAEDMRLARRLFAIAIETPGGLKVQTIHAFCERLLQRFSLEADVPPGFAILDDHEKAELLREAVDKVLTEATAPGHEASPLARAVRNAVRFAAESSFDDLLSEALRARDWIAAIGEGTDGEAGLRKADAIYRRALGLLAADTLENIEQALSGVMSDAELKTARGIYAGSPKSTDQACATRIDKVLRAAGPLSRIPALCELFLTGDREPRKSLMTKGLAGEFPDVNVRLEQAQKTFTQLLERRARLQVHEASLSLLRIAAAVMAHYAHAKAQRAALDFEDLVAKAAQLLGRSDAVEWVLFKLDGGLDHILVDEAQDTSPLQWNVVKALAQEFFSGHGQSEAVRTIFAVGDEKQSIYGFQGAAPNMFREMQADFAHQAISVGARWQKVALGLSFRTVAPLLEAVDRVFAEAARTPGVGSEMEPHVAFRAGHAGRVEIWPVEEPSDDSDTSQPWEPLSAPVSSRPAARLAARIADTIKGWLDRGERLASENRPIRPGDILILVRKRAPFAPQMVSALKAKRIPVAGADRLPLTQQIAVMDLMALGQVMLLPEDDLSLAALLKSPLIGLDDDDLIALAPERDGSLWQALQEARAARYAKVVETLQHWRTLSTRLAPYEFFAALLDGEGYRTRMLARLGPDAADPIDEFLNLALGFGEHAPPTLQGFLAALRASDHEIKRDMEQGRDEVRVMTVHGSKGLEAPIVFLPDTCQAAAGKAPGTLVTHVGEEIEEGAPQPFLWPVKDTSRVPAIQAGRAARETAEREERHRLLYVALTRPRDRLYVAGFKQSKARLAEDCWYALVSEALAPAARKETQADGRTVLVIENPQTAEPVAKAAAHAAREIATAPVPDWISRKAPAEPVLTVPLSPSRLAPLEMEAGDASKPAPRAMSDKRPREPVILPPAILADEARFLRGTLTHALLEHLPTLPAAAQEPAAHAFLAAQAPRLSKAARAGIVTETITILRDPAFAPLFGPDSRAEVALSAEIPRPAGQNGPALRLAGKIDRIVRQGNSVLIVDFKTNRPPPDTADKVADAYLLQLAAYRLAVQSIFRGCDIRCAILWTDGPRIMEIAAPMLDAYEAKVCGLDTAVLDA